MIHYIAVCRTMSPPPRYSPPPPQTSPHKVRYNTCRESQNSTTAAQNFHNTRAEPAVIKPNQICASPTQLPLKFFLVSTTQLHPQHITPTPHITRYPSTTTTSTTKQPTTSPPPPLYSAPSLPPPLHINGFHHRHHHHIATT